MIAVDLGGTKILAGLVDAAGNVEQTLEDPTPVASQGELLDALERSVATLRTPDTAAVGFGVPARVDPRTGFALGAVNIPLGDLPFAAGTAILRRLLDPRVPLTQLDAIVEWGLAAKRTAIWPSKRYG